jgi:hypothetical protein
MPGGGGIAVEEEGNEIPIFIGMTKSDAALGVGDPCFDMAAMKGRTELGRTDRANSSAVTPRGLTGAIDFRLGEMRHRPLWIA